MRGPGGPGPVVGRGPVGVSAGRGWSVRNVRKGRYALRVDRGCSADCGVFIVFAAVVDCP